MAGNGAQEKTEKATPRRLQEARKKGQVAKSTDFNSALGLLALLILFITIEKSWTDSVTRFMTGYLQSFSMYSGEPGRALSLWLVFSLKFVLPIFIIASIFALLSNIGQIGFLFAPEALNFKWERLNPAEGIKRMFSMRSLAELIKSLLKLGLIGGVAVIFTKGRLAELLLVFNNSPTGMMLEVGGFILSVLWACCLAYLGLAVLDLAYQRYDFQKNMRMSKQELKEEYKQTEGDPLLKAKQRERRREILMNRIVEEVPKATVVVTNPTHLAVALRYEDGQTEVPVVVAKGAGHIAERIKELARENRVPVIENKEVARFLYRNTDLGKQIPPELYQAVAEILALVYRLKGRRVG